MIGNTDMLLYLEMRMKTACGRKKEVREITITDKH